MRVSEHLVGELMSLAGIAGLPGPAKVKRLWGVATSDASDIVSKIIYYALVLRPSIRARGFWSEPGRHPVGSHHRALPKVVVAIIIVVISAAIAAAVKTLIQGSLGGLSYGKTLADIASIVILGIGIIAALNQVDIATTVTTPILIAVLAAIVGILGVVGGLIKPMSARWEQYLNKAEEEAPRIKANAQNAPPARDQITEAAQDYLPTQDESGSGAHRL
ncbi:hypothetical protein BJQ89_03486 [Arthrobacter sp. ES1]|nr:hypothetical protein [Arthrobacter sp. ES1]